MCRFILISTTAALLTALSPFAAEKLARPRHDPPDQLFRRAPMAQSARSIVVNLGTDLHYAFDSELARVHTVWVGGPLNLWGPPYSYAKTPFICDFDGKTLFSFPSVSPWFHGRDNLQSRFRAITTEGGNVAFSYDLLDGQDRIPIIESWRAASGGVLE